MQKMTLHEAQAAVAAIYKREGWDSTRFDMRIDWEHPRNEAVRFAVKAGVNSGPAHVALYEVSDILLAYHAHTVFEAGKAFAEAAIIRHADNKGDVDIVREIRDGLHYAEEIHQ